MSPRVVRISVTDADATDSSSGEEEVGATEAAVRRRAKKKMKLVKEITIDDSSPDGSKSKTPTGTTSGVGGFKVRFPASVLTAAEEKKKFRGVRQRPWGRWAAEIRCSRAKRLWLGTFNTAEEAAKAYDNAAIQLLGPQARTNFASPTINPSPEKLNEGNTSTLVCH